MIGPYPDREFLDLHRHLVLTPGPPNHEEPRRHALAAFLTNHGIESQTDPAGNLIVALGKGLWSETAVLDAHLDVVERGAATEVRNDGEFLHGLGVGDNQAAVTMLALALVRLAPRAAELSRPLVFLFSTGEEGLGNLRGVRQFVSDHPEAPHVFLAFDGTRESHSLSGVGSLRYRLTVEARLDCSNLPETHQRGSAYRTSRQLDDVPACARPTRVYLYPGDFTRYAAGDGPAKVHDHPLQTT